MREAEKQQNKKENMSEDQVVNVGLTIEEIKYAAGFIRNNITPENEPAVLAKLERVIEAYDYVAKREAKRKKAADAEERETEAVELLSRGVTHNDSLCPIGWYVSIRAERIVREQ